MGLQRAYLDFIEDCIQSELGGFAGRSMLELGDQLIRPSEIPERTGKEYFENRGVRHVSFDLNRKNGALAVDLSRPITDPQWLGTFDIVTNFGTSEHVEPFEAQYECFKNVHDCLKSGGIAVHINPDLDALERFGYWEGHCNNYYSLHFFEELVRLNGYRFVSTKVVAGGRYACIRKLTDAPFTDDRDALLAGIGRRSGGTVYPGINGPAAPSASTKFVRKQWRSIRKRFRVLAAFSD